MTAIETDRRQLILGPLLTLAAMPLGLGAARAAGVDPTMTIVTRPDEIPWKPLYNLPPPAVWNRRRCSARSTRPDNISCWSAGIPAS